MEIFHVFKTFHSLKLMKPTRKEMLLIFAGLCHKPSGTFYSNSTLMLTLIVCRPFLDYS